MINSISYYPNNNFYNAYNTNNGNVNSTLVQCAKRNIDDLTSGKTNVYEKYKNNKEFQALQNSNYFVGANGLQNLTNLVRDLEINKNKAIIAAAYSDLSIFPGYKKELGENVNITKCLYNLNKIINDPRIEQSVKNYVMKNANDLKFHVKILDEIDEILGCNDLKKINNAICSPMYWWYY